jgi:hypothetical protein
VSEVLAQDLACPVVPWQPLCFGKALEGQITCVKFAIPNKNEKIAELSCGLVERGNNLLDSGEDGMNGDRSWLPLYLKSDSIEDIVFVLGIRV